MNRKVKKCCPIYIIKVPLSIICEVMLEFKKSHANLRWQFIMHDNSVHLPMALITGSGHRLGREIAVNLGMQGYFVAIHYNSSSSRAEETLDILKKLEVPAMRFQADLTEEDQIKRLFDRIKATGHTLKVLVNSAGVMIHRDIFSTEVDDWDLTMDLNLRAVWLCSSLAYHHMKEHGGNIINISDSGAGRMWTGYPAYSISKAAVEVLTQLLAKSFTPNIRVNAIAPGLILPSNEFPADKWENLVNKLPLKKQGNVEQINEGINFLIQNEYITGQTIVIDGGYQLV